MPARSRILDMLLVPDPGSRMDKPTRDQLREMSYRDRRQAKMRYAVQGGMFRTWVYAVVLILLVGGLALYVSQVG